MLEPEGHGFDLAHGLFCLEALLALLVEFVLYIGLLVHVALSRQ